MSRTWVWLQVLLGWVPVWALYTALIVVMHGGPLLDGALIGAMAVLPAAFLGVLVHRLAMRYPWPVPFRLSFALMHLVAAPLFALAWIAADSIVESIVYRRLLIAGGGGFLPFIILGIWLYVMVAGVSYAIETTKRAAQAEASAARMQLSALRGQLNPHFLFNALHTVVQLIPVHPENAADAAEQLAELLRTTMEEDRDVVTLGDEWTFVSRYLAIERIRFGDRLRVHADLAPELLQARVPSFSVQTLVENAVRHGAAPKVEATDVFVSASRDGRAIRIRVADNGHGTSGDASGAGTGLSRLRERLNVLYGGAAELVIERPATGFAVTLVIPQREDDA